MPRRRSQQPPRQPPHPVAIGVPVAARPAPTANAVPVTSSTTSAQQMMHVAPPAQETTAWTARLNDPDPRVRVAAVRALSKVDKTTLAQHADALIARLDDPDLGVRWSALDTRPADAGGARAPAPCRAHQTRGPRVQSRHGRGECCEWHRPSSNRHHAPLCDGQRIGGERLGAVILSSDLAYSRRFGSSGVAELCYDQRVLAYGVLEAELACEKRGLAIPFYV